LKKQSNNRSRLKLIGKWLSQISTHWGTISTIYLSVGGFLTLKLFQLQKKGNMTTLLLLLIVSELALMLLTLSLSTSCIIKYFKTRIRIPKKNIIQFLLIFKNNEHFTPIESVKRSGFQIDLAKMYIEILLEHNYIIKTEINPLDLPKFSLGKKGINYLRKNHLLD